MTTHPIPLEAKVVDESWEVSPGDTLNLGTGTRGRLRLASLQGTADDPIVVRAENLTIQTAKTFTGLDITDCSYVQVQGEQLSLQGTVDTNCGLIIRHSHHIDVGGLDIQGQRAGIRCRTLVDNAPDGWTQDGITIHHCHIHDVLAEAMYLGKAPNQDPPAVPLMGLVVENCLVERCGWDGIQARNAPDAVVRYNEVRDITVGEASALGMGRAGFIIGEATAGVWHDNMVLRTPRGFMLLHHSAGVDIHHNVMAECEHGILVHTKAPILFHHNTAILCGVLVPGGEVRDNLIAEGFLMAGVAQNNIRTSTIEAARFVNWEAGDYHPRANSPAVGAASDGGDCGAFPHSEETLEDRVAALEYKLDAVAAALRGFDATEI